MRARGGIAYAHARMLAWKSRLLTRMDAAPLFTASNAAEMQRVLGALEIRDPLARLLRVYGMAIRGYPHGAALFRALLRLREVENVKLLWRLTAKPSRRDALERLWIDLGELSTVPRLDAATPNALAEALRSTPYGSIAATVARVHGNDVSAAELALERWVSQQLREETQRLPRRETLSRRLIESVLRKRDAQLAVRAAKWYGLATVSSVALDVVVLRRERLRLCRRAFVGSPFLLAPAIAIVLLAEEEVRAVRALVEREGDETLDAAMVRALAASQIGA
jgi:vacuolar-type H+-ATPase subunit C/Vma6